MTVVALIRRLRGEFTAMPGLRLTEEQVQRLCDADASTSASALRALVSVGLLRALEDGGFRRADIAIDSSARATSGGMTAPWRRILCLVEFDDDSRASLTAASHSALCYATTLGVAHRARVTALRLTPKVPDTTAERQALLEQVAGEIRRHTGAITPGSIDVHVAAGASNEDVLPSARETGADLIVLGRREGGAACLPQFREMLRDAPCHVLIVHPSGQAAVA